MKYYNPLDFLSREQKMWRANINPYQADKIDWYVWLAWSVAVMLGFLLCLPALATLYYLIK